MTLPTYAPNGPDNRRRFIFRGNAAAFGGHIIRPKEYVLEAPGSALPVTGGQSVSRIPRTVFGDAFGVDAAETYAQGLFTDKDKYREYTFHRVEQDTLVAATRVYADITNLFVGSKPRMRIAHLRAELSATSPLGSGQPAISLAHVSRDGVHIDGVDIDGYKLVIELNTEPFRQYNTYAKLLAAADEQRFVESNGDALLMRTARRGEAPPPPAGRLMQASYGTIYTTIVKKIRWDGPEFPKSTIVGNKVILPEFGVAYFGELLISDSSRRLTMVRWRLGSDGGGDASGGDVQDNGGWSWTP